MNWKVIRGIALGRLVFMPFFALVGFGLILGATNPVGLGLGALLLGVAVAGFGQAVVDFRRSGRGL